MTRWDQWVRGWMRAYPRRFRDRFGADLARQYPPPRTGDRGAALRTARDLLRGGLGARLDDARAAWYGASGSGGIDGLRADAAHAWRGLVRRPMFASLVVATLALAAGLNTAVFGIVDATLLRPLPYPDDGRLAWIGNAWTGYPAAAVSLPEFVDYQARARSFSAMTVYSHTSLNLSPAGGAAERVQGVRATASFFDVLGVAPAMGRVFSPEEDVAGAPVAVISHGFWRRRFGGDPGILGRTLASDDGARQIIGVMPVTFTYPSALSEVWVPMNLVPGDAGARGAHNRQVIARLADGVPLARAQDEMRRIGAQLRGEYPTFYPDGSGFDVVVTSLRDRLVGDVRGALQVLMAAVLFVLLIACANVANLLVARGAARSRETATCLAFGATRLRLVRQSLFEGLLTGIGGAVGGILIAAWLLGALEAWLPEGLPRPDRILTDRRVLGFALLLTAAAGAFTAALTSIRATYDPTGASLNGGRATAAAHRSRAMLTTAQIALAVLLLTCGGFAMRSFVRLVQTSPGLRTDQVATARVALSPARYPDGPARAAFLDRVHDALRAQPGVVAAGAVSMLPLTGQTNDWSFGVEGFTPDTPGRFPTEQSRVVHGDYFRVLDIPLRAGRSFGDGDSARSPRVAIVSELFARKYFADQDAIGRRIRRWGLDSDEPWTTIVGIVADIRHEGLDEAPVPFVYYPASQIPQGGMTLLARLDAVSRGGPQVIAAAVRSVDPAQPTWSPRMMDEWLARSISTPRFNLLLLSLFAGLAMLLAAVGVYGVTAFAVARRTRELGIRAALGARPGSLLRFVVGESARLAAVGCAIGGVGAVAAGSWLRAAFHDIRLADPGVVAGIPLFVFVVAVAASYLPARRAMRVDPADALRAE